MGQWPSRITTLLGEQFVSRATPNSSAEKVSTSLQLLRGGHDFPYALHELGACIKQSEYGANFSTNDFEAEAARAEHEANGLVSMF